MGSLDSPAMQHLVTARAAALENVALYPQVMPPILGLVSDNRSLDLQRWVADFIAEALASPTLPTEEKEKMVLPVLPILKSFLEAPDNDVQVLKSAIQASASSYPLVFRHIITHPNDSHHWDQLLAIKSHILRNMDSYTPGIRICAIKFVQKVVQTQTLGIIADPRRTEQNEISLALVPRDHPLLQPTKIEAETSGLLDRVLDILNDKSSDILVLTATINSLSVLVKSRPALTPRIIQAIVHSDPYKFVKLPITTRTKIELRSIERTFRALFSGAIKRQPNHPMREKMDIFLGRLAQSKIAILDETTRKRPAPAEPSQDMDNGKRQKLEPVPIPIPPVAAPPTISLAQLFSISTDPQAQAFDVTLVPFDIVKKIIVPILRGIDSAHLQAATNMVRVRLQTIADAHAASRASANAPLGDDDDDYEPDYEPVEDAAQLQNRLEMESSDLVSAKASQVSLGPFNLPIAPPLPPNDLDKMMQLMMTKIFRRIDDFTASTPQKAKSGLNRLAASSSDRMAMLTNFIRLLTRPTAGLFSGGDSTKADTSAVSAEQLQLLADNGRQQLLQYILHNWTLRMDIATAWLTEEWYNDLMCKQEFDKESDGGRKPPPMHFKKWSHRFLDELSAFISHEHQNLLIRFVSEVPGLDSDLINKVKRLALDPERIGMTVKVLYYLTMFRPPVKEICLDAIEDLYKNYDGTKMSTTSILKKFRPHVVAEVPTESS
ncbi:hypothetical protein BT63DRAFT_449199 [Microthyrium microscopicum]|uniref:Symplekin/Pta1 N-terminal domain-containing protein n=1 Tax=Microthyrium microscopicum TaxID=703497 RepID=A0A6A6UTD7_9PEZI|nr:hypothetical protein BT63DRAFT_449199 [Microthyrium microscopicum]